MMTQRNSSMYRSGSMPFSLPKISNLNAKQSRYGNNPNRSSFQQINSSRGNHSKSFMQSSRQPFTHRVQQQVFAQNEYPYIETTNIQKQHGKLKDLLKQFNEQTVAILQKYVIDKPIKKQYVKKKIPIQVVHNVSDKQAENCMTLIQLLKNQIQKLEGRCENLKYTSKDQFQHKIKELSQEKHSIIVQNKQLSREITLNGLNIMKGKQSMVKQLQYEHFLIDSKRQRLKTESETVKTEITALQQKTKQILAQIDNYEQQQSYSLKQYEQIQKQKSQNRLYEDLVKKTKILQHNKIMNQSTNYQLKHKYFQKLKEFDDYGTKDQANNVKITEFEDFILKSKQNIQQLETKWTQITKRQKEKTDLNQAKINLLKNMPGKISVSLQ